MSYCKYVNQTLDLDANTKLHKQYHDTQYGFPIDDDNELFGRLILEMNQAGLSWITILQKQDNFRKAFDHFNIQKIAAYSTPEIQRLMHDKGIIRNQLKILSVIHNANVVLQIQEQYGSFQQWLKDQGNLKKEEWMKRFKKTFKFTGGEIVNEFLVSTGFLKGAHQADCPIYHQVIKTKPHWLKYE